MLTRFATALADMIYGAPARDSNEHLRRWLAANPEKDPFDFPLLP